MLTRFSTDPKQLTTVAQVRSYRAFRQFEGDIHSLAEKARQFDGTPDDLDGQKDDHVVLFQTKLSESGPEYTGFVDARDHMQMEYSGVQTNKDGTEIAYKRTITSKQLEDSDEELFTYKQESTVAGRTSVQVQKFHIDHAEGWGVHQS